MSQGPGKARKPIPPPANPIQVQGPDREREIQLEIERRWRRLRIRTAMHKAGNVLAIVVFAVLLLLWKPGYGFFVRLLHPK